jgi:hypothetical protein
MRATGAVDIAKINLDFIRANLSRCTTNSLADGAKLAVEPSPAPGDL